MPLVVGADVIVRPLANKRGVIIAVGRDGRYHVRVGGVTTWVREEDLAAPEEAKKRKRGRSLAASTTRHSTAAAASNDDPVRSGRVDLHGLRVEEAIARAIEEIDDALQRGADRVEIVHGKGSGRIREALHRHLRSMTVVARFRLDPRNPGVTWVYF